MNLRLKIKQCCTKWQRVFTTVSLWLACLPVWASIPTPPSADMANGSSDWLDVMATMGYRAIQIVCVIVGGSLLIGVVGVVYSSYKNAHEKQDLGIFFKTLVVGLIVAALGMGLLYASTQIVPASSS